jgi:hypothetical protein
VSAKIARRQSSSACSTFWLSLRLQRSHPTIDKATPCLVEPQIQIERELPRTSRVSSSREASLRRAIGGYRLNPI